MWIEIGVANMWEQRRGDVLWDRVALAALIVIFVFVGVWWLESRFDSLVAVMTLGLIGGAAFFVGGALFNQRNTKMTLENAADFLHEVSTTQSKAITVSGQYARMERDAFNQRAKLDVIDAKRVDQLAQQRAKALQAPTQIEVPQSQVVDTWDDAEFIEIS